MKKERRGEIARDRRNEKRGKLTIITIRGISSQLLKRIFKERIRLPRVADIGNSLLELSEGDIGGGVLELGFCWVLAQLVKRVCLGFALGQRDALGGTSLGVHPAVRELQKTQESALVAERFGESRSDKRKKQGRKRSRWPKTEMRRVEKVLFVDAWRWVRIYPRQSAAN